MSSVTVLFLPFKNLIKLPELPDDLRELYCNNNRLIVLPELPNSLKYLSCDHNYLNILPQLPNSLKYLSCCKNSLTSLPKQLPVTLQQLECTHNRLTYLPDHLPNSLKTLECWNNYLVKLPEFPMENLRWIAASYNPFLFNDRKFADQNPESWTNYKILCKIQKLYRIHRITSVRNRSATTPLVSKKHCRFITWIYSLVKRKKKVNCNYFCRDITRLCDKY